MLFPRLCDILEYVSKTESMLIAIIWILIILSLLAVGAVVFRKFTVLANIDVENIESEKQAAVKKRIVSEKFQRSLNKWLKKLWRWVGPFFIMLNNFFAWLYRCLLHWKEKYSQTDLQPHQDVAQQVSSLFAQAQDLIHKEDLAGAENKYIEIIGLDSKSFKAFQLLGQLYLDRQNYQEAEQTLRHAAKLKMTGQSEPVKDLELANVYYYLSQVYQAQNDTLGAVKSLKQALEIEPNNPRYLDKMIDLCIIVKNKGEAFDACQKLEQVNPENQKLADLKQKITNL